MKRNYALWMATGCLAIASAISANAQETVFVEEESVSVADVSNCKTQYYVDKHDNVFLQLGAGVGVPIVENELDNGQNAKRHMTAIYNLGVGKWFSPYLGFRFSGYYGSMHWDNDNFSKAKKAELDFDIMWDMCNSLGGVNPDRPVSVIPFVGVGGALVWDINSEGSNIYKNATTLRTREWTLPVSAGIQFRFRLCRYVDFFLEGRAGFYGDNFNGCAYNKSIDMFVSAIGGFNINFGGVKYQAYNPCKDMAYINSLNGQVNALRGELAATAAALTAAEAQLPCPEAKAAPAAAPVVNAAPMMSTVRFAINSDKISDEEMVNVYNTAEYMKANPNLNVVIKGFADKDTGSAEYNKGLSERRANAVANALTKTYGINSNRLTIEGEGSAVQPYDVNNWNRIVIFVPAN